MRAALVLVLLAGTASAQPKQKIAILGLEVISSGTPTTEAVRVAQDFTVGLRVQPRAGKGPYNLGPGTERELVDEKLMADRASEAAPCMSKIGASLGVDVLLYGRLDRRGADNQVSIRLFDIARKKMVIGWTDLIPVADASGTKLQDWATKGYKRVTDRHTASAPTAPSPPPPPVPATPRTPANPRCDSDTPVAKGDDAYASGQYAAALASYEAALKCKADPVIVSKAFASSCRARNAAKAKLYYGKLSAAQRTRFAQICVREGIDPK